MRSMVFWVESSRSNQPGSAWTTAALYLRGPRGVDMLISDFTRGCWRKFWWSKKVLSSLCVPASRPSRYRWDGLFILCEGGGFTQLCGKYDAVSGRLGRHHRSDRTTAVAVSPFFRGLTHHLALSFPAKMNSPRAVLSSHSASRPPTYSDRSQVGWAISSLRRGEFTQLCGKYDAVSGRLGGHHRSDRTTALRPTPLGAANHRALTVS
jgi:hypothetical protein